MKVERAELGRATDAVYDRVEAELADLGWVRRPLNVPSMAAFTLGRRDEAAAVLDGAPDLDGRFDRQVRRRLDDPALPVPPLADTMAILPSLPRLALPSRAQLTADSHAKRDARSVTRVQGRGRSAYEIRHLPLRSRRRRGRAVMPSVWNSILRNGNS